MLGSLLVTLAMACWGIDNNLTRNISTRNPIQITRIKGLVSGCVSISLAYALGTDMKWDISVFYALLLGSFRAGIFFSLAPFIGAVTSLVLLQEWIGWVMFPAMMLTVAGVWLISTEKHLHPHLHREATHTHLHNHNDIHHVNEHVGIVHEVHVHEHKHREEHHFHPHWPDTHHRHEH